MIHIQLIKFNINYESNVDTGHKFNSINKRLKRNKVSNMSKGITISPKHGVNCSIVICPICKKDTSLALFGRLKGDAEAPKQIEGELCDECKKKYITIIEVESEANKRGTGRCAYIPKEAVNVECKDGIALMATEEFTKMFVK